MTLPSIPAPLFLDLIGKPFERDARGPDTYDCLGLAIEFQRRRGAVLPAYLSEPEEYHRQAATGGMLSDARRLEWAEPGCLVLMRSPGRTRFHLGVMIDRFRMLHASEDVGSAVIETVANCIWGRRVLGYYHVELPA